MLSSNKTFQWLPKSFSDLKDPQGWPNSISRDVSSSLPHLFHSLMLFKHTTLSTSRPLNLFSFPIMLFLQIFMQQPPSPPSSLFKYHQRDLFRPPYREHTSFLLHSQIPSYPTCFFHREFIITCASCYLYDCLLLTSLTSTRIKFPQAYIF